MTMQSVQEIYRSVVSGLSSEERLELAALILRELAAPGIRRADGSPRWSLSTPSLRGAASRPRWGPTGTCAGSAIHGITERPAVTLSRGRHHYSKNLLLAGFTNTLTKWRPSLDRGTFSETSWISCTT